MKSKWDKSPAGRAWYKAYYANRHATATRRCFEHYGTSCARCGESDSRCLSIDHIPGDGAAQRRKKRRTGAVLYLWLVKQGFPAGHQTLCMNCQFKKRHENGEQGGRRPAPLLPCDLVTLASGCNAAGVPSSDPVLALTTIAVSPSDATTGIL